MSRQVTIRGGSEGIGEKLENLSRARGRSVSSTVLEILSSAVEEEPRRRRLARYVNWTEEDLAEFNQALAAQRTVEYLEERARRGSREKFEAALAMLPDLDPEPYDKL